MSVAVTNETNATTSKVKPATSFSTTNRSESVRLRLGSDGLPALEPITVPQLMRRAATNNPDVIALMQKDADNVWQSVTYSQYHENVLRTAKAFIKLGLEPYNAVAILAFNSPEWFYSELGAIHAGYVNFNTFFFVILNSSLANALYVQFWQRFSGRRVHNKFTGSGFPCVGKLKCKYCCGRRYEANGQNQRD